MTPTTQHVAPASRAARVARSAAIGFAASLALVAPQPAAAQDNSFLEGKSDGMRRCVSVILHGTKIVEKINVHGHHFNCRPMRRFNREGINFRRFWLDHAQFGKDDTYFVNFQVDERNVLVAGTMKMSITKGVSIDTLKRNAKWLNVTTAINSLLLKYVKSFPVKFEGPASLSYDNVARIAREIPAVETEEWETAAMEIALITIAEHGRSGAGLPPVGKIGTGESPVLKSQPLPAGELDIEKPGAAQKSGAGTSARSP